MHAWGAVDLRIYLAQKNHGYSISAQSYDFCPRLTKLDILDLTLSHIQLLVKTLGSPSCSGWKILRCNRQTHFQNLCPKSLFCEHLFDSIPKTHFLADIASSPIHYSSPSMAADLQSSPFYCRKRWWHCFFCYNTSLGSTLPHTVPTTTIQQQEGASIWTEDQGSIGSKGFETGPWFVMFYSS